MCVPLLREEYRRLGCVKSAEFNRLGFEQPKVLSQFFDFEAYQPWQDY
jgi:hypothetical protein